MNSSLNDPLVATITAVFKVGNTEFFKKHREIAAAGGKIVHQEGNVGLEWYKSRERETSV